MGLFKEINCVHCGKKTNMLTRSKLADGQYVCGKCTSKVPTGILGNLNEYTYDDFKELLVYLEESETKLAKVFKETHKFHSIHIDLPTGDNAKDAFEYSLIWDTITDVHISKNVDLWEDWGNSWRWLPFQIVIAVIFYVIGNVTLLAVCNFIFGWLQTVYLILSVAINILFDLFVFRKIEKKLFNTSA